MVLMVYCSLLFSSVSYFNLLVPAFPQDLGLIFPVSQSWGFLFLVRQWQLRDPHSPHSVQDWAALLCGWALTVVTAEASLRLVSGKRCVRSWFSRSLTSQEACFSCLSRGEKQLETGMPFPRPPHVLASLFPQRPAVDEALREGHVNLSGLQLRAHAMFSAEGLPLGSDSLEYAWLIDVQAGSLTAKVTAPQVRVSEYCPRPLLLLLR